MSLIAKIRPLLILVIFTQIFIGCALEEVPKDFISDVTVYDERIGDYDGFGFGLEDNIWRSNSEGFFDHRQGDPYFTDIFPTIRDTLSLEYTHTIDIEPGSSVIRASIYFRTFSLQDGNPGEIGTASNLRLFLDQKEIPNAFDEVDQFSIINGERGSTAGTISYEIPKEQFNDLMDGELNVSLRFTLKDDDFRGLDAFAIDYSFIRVEYVN